MKSINHSSFLKNSYGIFRLRYVWQEYGNIVISIFCILLSGLIFEKRSAGEFLTGVLSSTYWIRLGILVIGAGILATHVKRVRFPHNISLTGYTGCVVLAVLSLMWSTSALTTFGKLIPVVLALIIVSIRSRKDRNSGDGISLVWCVVPFMMVVVLIATIGFLLQIPGFSTESTGGFITAVVGKHSTAPFISGNSVGYFSGCLLCIFTACRVAKTIRMTRWLLLCIVFGTCLVCSGSRTSFAMTIVTAIFLYVKANSSSFKKIIFFLAICMCYLSWEHILYFMQGNSPDKAFYSLSGRTILWEYALSTFQQHPYIGFGAGIGTRVLIQNVTAIGFDEDISSIHNSFFEMLLDLGIFGALFWTISIVSSLCIVTRNFSRKGEIDYICSGIIIYCCGIGLMTSNLAFSSLNCLNFLYLITIARHSNQGFRTYPKIDYNKLY